MDDEELESLTNVLQNRIDELDAEDNKPVKTTDPETTTESQLIEPLFPEREEGCVRLIDSRSSVGVYDKSAPHGIQVAVSNPEEPAEPKIIYPETDEYNFDGFDIDVQMGGEQTTFSNTVIDTELEDELDMETIINMRAFLQNKVFFAKFHDMPVNYCFMERLEDTLDDLLNKTGGISEEEWLSILFQVVFGLAVANKHYSFVHNDLHSDNILFQSTKETYIYYAIKDVKDIKDKSVAKKKEQEDTTSKSKGKYKIYRID
jgi:serine/threonine protein kinase